MSKVAILQSQRVQLQLAVADLLMEMTGKKFELDGQTLQFTIDAQLKFIRGKLNKSPLQIYDREPIIQICNETLTTVANTR
jgi:hypothetical protein